MIWGIVVLLGCANWPVEHCSSTVLDKGMAAYCIVIYVYMMRVHMRTHLCAHTHTHTVHTKP